MLKKVITWLASYRKHIAIGAVAGLFLGILYGYRLGSLVRGDSAYESIIYLHINGLADLLANIAFGPIAFGQMLAVKIDEPNSTLMRLLSALVVCASIIVFYRLLSKWHSPRIAILTTILFATSSYSLHLGRFSLQDSLYYLVIPSLLLAGTWLKSKRLVHRMRYAAPAAVFFLYIPGAVYVVTLLGIVFQKRLRLAWQHTSIKNRIIGCSAGGLIALPLIYGLLRYPSQIKEFLAIDRVIAAPMESVEALGSATLAIFWNGTDEPYRWLTGTPLLDVATIVLVILGAYSYIKGTHTLRVRILAGLTIMSLLLIATGTLVTHALIVPVLYIIAANGIAYLLQSWFTVFPRNPAARNTGIIAMVIVVALISSYHVQRYFIAWPNTPATQEALQLPLEKVLQ